MKHTGSVIAPLFPMDAAISQENRIAVRFEELAMPIIDSLYNLARWLTRNDYDAEDLVQETYLKAFRSFDSFRTGTNFRAWILCILRNSFLSSRTRLGAISNIPLPSEDEGPELAVESDTPESIFMDRAESELVFRAIDELPLHYREVILLCDVEEMAYREIAEILSIPIGTVMSRLARARGRIRDFLDDALQRRRYPQPLGSKAYETCQ